MKPGEDVFGVIEKAAQVVMGDAAHQEFWTDQQVFDVAKEAKVQLLACVPPVKGFTARAVRVKGRPAVIYNVSLTEHELRVHVIGELAAAIALRDYPDACRLDPGFEVRVAQDMRQKVCIASEIIRADRARLAA